MVWCARLVLFAAALVAGLAAPPTGALARQPKPPAGSFGVVADGPLFDPRVDMSREMGVMAGAGVESVRFSMYWNTAQRYGGAGAAPPGQGGRCSDGGGVPTDYTAIDGVVSLAAARHLRLLRVVLRTPPWARLHPDIFTSPPPAAGRAAYARFLGALV